MRLGVVLVLLVVGGCATSAKPRDYEAAAKLSLEWRAGPAERLTANLEPQGCSAWLDFWGAQARDKLLELRASYEFWFAISHREGVTRGYMGEIADRIDALTARHKRLDEECRPHG